MRWEILFYLIPQFIYQSKSERTIEIDPYLSVHCTAQQHWTEYKITCVSDVRSECEKLQMTITQQRVIRATLGLVLDWVFSEDGLALHVFNVTAHELHELYYDRPTS